MNKAPDDLKDEVLKQADKIFISKYDRDSRIINLTYSKARKQTLDEVKKLIVKNWDFYISEDGLGHNPSFILNDIDKLEEVGDGK